MHFTLPDLTRKDVPSIYYLYNTPTTPSQYVWNIVPIHRTSPFQRHCLPGGGSRVPVAVPHS